MDPDILAKLGLSTGDVNTEEKWSCKATNEAVDHSSDIFAQLGLSSTEAAGDEAWEKQAEEGGTTSDDSSAVEADLLASLGVDASALGGDETWEKKAAKESSDGN